jgi:hypothetical protein
MATNVLLGKDSPEPKAYAKLREVVSDAYAFIRSAEANQAFATVTLEALMVDQILRNGESDQSKTSEYNPYSYDPTKSAPAGTENIPSVVKNFAGGSDTGSPSKLVRLAALTNELSRVIDEIKRIQPVELADSEEYTAMAEISVPEEEEE